MPTTGNRLLCRVNRGVAIIFSVVAAVFAGCTDELIPPSVESYPNPDFRSLFSVSDTDAPNDLLFDWVGGDISSLFGSNQVSTTVIEELRSGANVFDCVPYLLDDSLIAALQGAEHLRWLRVGAKAKADDLRWISGLSRLRGLSLRGADLSQADFGLLQKLKSLEWLDLSFTILPQESAHRIPSLPNLELLFLHNSHVTDDLLPVKEQSPKLKTLTLAYSLITDDGLVAIVNACPNLQFFNFSHSPNVTTKSSPILTKLKGLKFLHFGDTPMERALTPSQFLEYRKQFSGCQVEICE